VSLAVPEFNHLVQSLLQITPGRTARARGQFWPGMSVEANVFARLHTLETTAEQYEEGLRLVRDELLPWARESSGFRGLIGLVDRTHGRALVLTLWADGEALERSAAAGDRLSALAAEVTGAKRLSLENFEVSLLELFD
jgi:hypothetical protein